MSRRLMAVAAIMAAGMITLPAGSILVPNASFELPLVSYAAPAMDSWQKTPRPDWYVEGGGFSWDQLTGTFKNDPPSSTVHIDNCHGNQAAWLFAVPEVGLSQDYDSMDGNDPVPTHAFNAPFKVGKAYRLQVGILVGTSAGTPMQEGVTLALSLYYRDASSNRIAVVTTVVTNSANVFSNGNHFLDFEVKVPTVQPAEPWAGRNIGIQFLSTVTSNLQGGYWDLDNVRLTETGPAILTSPAWTNGQFSFLLQSEPGLAFDILTTTDPALPSSNWINLGPLTNVTGTVPFVDTAPNLNQRFYRARQLP